MKISYISNIPQNESSGGMSGINNAVFTRLQSIATNFSYQLINPSVSRKEKYISKLQKLVNIPRDYFYFSEKRLNIINEEFLKDENTDFYFFHGFTPWIKITPDKPYFCYNDGCFGTYIEHYNNKKEFHNNDINRIFEKEKNWLQNAKAVFFQSRWALNETKKYYHIKGENFFYVGVGGFIEIPEVDVYDGGKEFLFISREFGPKGGREAVKAIQLVREHYPEVKLIIIGEKPEKDCLNLPGINYAGFLNKNQEQDLEKLKSVFEKVFALVHPTIKDINPLVINELAYFGCPSISTNCFAIPEYLINNITGLLVEDPRNIEEIATKMMELLNNNLRYREMRKHARLNAINNNTWENVLSCMVEIINEKL